MERRIVLGVMVVAIIMTMPVVGKDYHIPIIADGEPTLLDILNATYGHGNYVQLSGSDFWFTPGIYTATTIYVNVTAHKASFLDPTGWYDRGTSHLNEIFFAPKEGDKAIIATSAPFGLYINSSVKGSELTTYYTEASKNDDKLMHAKVFSINGRSAPTFAIGFEDYITYDQDFQDVVLELQGADLGIPEFPSVAMPVAAVLGLMYFFQYRKNRKE